METTMNKEIMKENAKENAVEQLVCEECGEVLTDLVEGEDYVVINNNGSNHIVCKDCLSVSTLTDNLFFCGFHNRIESEEYMEKTIVNPEMTGEYTVCDNGLYALRLSGEISKCDGCGEYFSNENTTYDGCTSVCNNCWESGEYELCSDCGNIINLDYDNYERVYNGGIVCSNCANEYYRCDECGYLFDREEVRTDDYAHCYCNRCYDSLDMIECSDCGRIISVNDSYYDEDEECYYCDGCEGNRNTYIHDYNYKPETRFFITNEEDEDNYNNEFMGVELEVDRGYKIKETAANVVAASRTEEYLASNCPYEYESEKNGLVYLKHDGSLGDVGFEIVSRPCSFKYHLTKFPWEEIMDACLKNNYRSHQTSDCGLHVHVNRSYFGECENEQDFNIAKTILIIERFWQNIIKFTRRRGGELQQWAKPNEIGIDDYDTKETAIEKCKEQKNIMRRHHGERYHAVNLQNSNTVEFRIFKGTLKYNTFIATLEFVHIVCEKAIKWELKKILNSSWEDLFEEVTFPEIKQYLAERNILPECWKNIIADDEFVDDNDEE